MTPFAATTSYTLTELLLSSLGVEAAENLIVAFTVSATDNKARCSLEGDAAVMDMWHRSQNQRVAAVDWQRCVLVFNDNDLGFHSKASYKLFLRLGRCGN